MFDYTNYYRLEYLQTGGTQRIDTGIKGYCEFEIDFQLTSPGTAGYNSFFGSRQDGATNRFGCFNYNNIFHFMTGTGSTWNIAVDTNRHLIHFNSSLFTDNGTEYAVSVPGGSYGSSNFYLMWCNGLSGGSNGYWYYAKFWDSEGNLIRHYIPAQRKSDSVLGMYDAVNNTFTVNSGSGSFTAGRIVSELKVTPDPSDGGEITLTLPFDYTGAIQTFTVPKSGNYKLEAYGGSGGGNDNTHGYGGKGGYASGTKYLEKDTVLYIVCGGGAGNTYNGGGNGNRTAYSGTGGGATHIATVTGTLSSIGASNLTKILIVAGGGGGGGYNAKHGGDGGGLVGGDGTGSYYGHGGTQTAGGKNEYYKSQATHATFGTFGKGGSAETGIGSNDCDAGGGGGGLYGGAGGSWSSSNTSNGGGGGGSSYIDNLTDGHTESGVNEGNGYAIITFVSEEELFPSGTKLTLEAVPNRGYEFVDWELEGYTKLDYIQSSGTQYIDTGFIPNQDTRIDLKLVPLSASNDGVYVFGSGASYNNRAYELYVYNGVFQSGYGTSQINTVTATVGQTYEISKNRNVITINGTSYSNTANSFTSPYTLDLFALHRSSVLLPSNGMKLYYAKIWDNDVLVRDFIPVIRHSDYQIGMLDLCEMKFYGNAGTNKFNRFNESDTITTPAFTYSGFSWASWVSTYGAGVNNNYITIDFQKPVVVVEYEGSNHNDSSSIAWSFTIAGSNDNVTYTNIQTDAFPAKAFQAVTVRNLTAYRYYRLIYSAYNNSYSSRRYVFAHLSLSGYAEDEASAVTLYDNPLVFSLGESTSLIANFNRSANCRFKVNGEWKFAMMYVKVNGQWQQGLIRVKKNGSWKEGG